MHPICASYSGLERLYLFLIKFQFTHRCKTILQCLMYTGSYEYECFETVVYEISFANLHNLEILPFGQQNLTNV